MEPDKSFQCLACGCGHSEPVYTGCKDYYVGKPHIVDYRRCRECGLVQQFPVPGDVSAFYEQYPVHAPKSILHSILSRLRFADYWKNEDSRSGAVLLDYGCGDGSYLATQLGRGLQLLGYEPSASHARALTDRLHVPVYSDIRKLLEERSGSVDILTMHFVLEHLTSPREEFAQAARLLRPGGTFYFTIPQINSLQARWFGKKWHGLDAPRHISFLEPSIVQKLAADHGLRVIRHKGIPFPHGIAGSIPVVLFGKFVYPVFVLSFPLSLVLSYIVPTGCRAFWLTKESK
jgi:SAM-dependent methyltransferase